MGVALIKKFEDKQEALKFADKVKRTVVTRPSLDDSLAKMDTYIPASQVTYEVWYDSDDFLVATYKPASKDVQESESVRPLHIMYAVLFQRDKDSDFEPGILLNDGELGILDENGNKVSECWDYRTIPSTLSLNLESMFTELRSLCNSRNK